MTLWFVDQAGGGPAALQALLTQHQAAGWSVFVVLTNGIDRWTVVLYRTVETVTPAPAPGARAVAGGDDRAE
jgi:hypothetical protein